MKRVKGVDGKYYFDYSTEKSEKKAKKKKEVKEDEITEDEISEAI